jgi:hypothetical protein
MIDAAPSLREAKRLSTSALSDYLQSTGWAVRPSRIDGVAIFSKMLLGAEEPVNIVLPLLPNIEDDGRRIADALRTLEVVEERPIFEIVTLAANKDHEGVLARDTMMK